MNANEIAEQLENISWLQGDGKVKPFQHYANFVRQQQNEIEDLKNANRFIQNFAEEQHKRAVALEMRELTDEEIQAIAKESYVWNTGKQEWSEIDFARAILRKAQEK